MLVLIGREGARGGLVEANEGRGGQRSSTYVYLLGLDLEGETFHHALGRVAQNVVAEEPHVV